MSELVHGRTQAAWDLFVDRYRRLIIATIRRLVTDDDDVMDVFSTVCEALSANDFARLRRYSNQAARPSSVATWLVIVVRNLTVDWLRQRDGRRRIAMPSGLSPLQQEIYSAICIAGYSHVEAFETIRSRTQPGLSFAGFLAEVRTTQRLAPCKAEARFRGAPPEPLPEDVAAKDDDTLERDEIATRLAAALATQPDDVRVAIDLFVVEGMAAADVARVVGWLNAKAVYNRVSRVLASLRSLLEQEGVGPSDLG